MRKQSITTSVLTFSKSYNLIMHLRKHKEYNRKSTSVNTEQFRIRSYSSRMILFKKGDTCHFQRIAILWLSVDFDKYSLTIKQMQSLIFYTIHFAPKIPQEISKILKNYHYWMWMQTLKAIGTKVRALISEPDTMPSHIQSKIISQSEQKDSQSR